MMIFKKVVGLIVGDPSSAKLTMPKKSTKKQSSRKLTERELIQLESEIGAKLFGDLPVDHRREFFCLDEKTWIWHEEFKNPETSKIERRTIRYEVHDTGILKVQEGARYSFISGDELKNLVAATTMYYEQIARNIYGRDPRTGQKLA